MAEATYELRVRGVVSNLALRTFQEMELQSDTLVSGVIQDQAALHGLLERIRDLGLELVDVHQLTNPQPKLESPAQPAGGAAKPSEPTHERQNSDE